MPRHDDAAREVPRRDRSQHARCYGLGIAAPDDRPKRSGAAVRFLSIEPLLEVLGTLNLDGINWVIVGGESGPGARKMETGCVLSVRDQCRAANVAFFFKQW